MLALEAIQSLLLLNSADVRAKAAFANTKQMEGPGFGRGLSMLCKTSAIEGIWEPT